MKNTQTTSPGCERWIWIELIGFDNTKLDCGAQEYLDRLGFIPDAVSYLITSPDIIHHHKGLETEVAFPADYCSYCGHPRSAERERQVWTNHQLRTLNRALQAHGIKVYLATFLFYLQNEFHEEWVKDYPELFETRRNGEHINSLMPLKRFSDGVYYEDFFIPRLINVMQDYEFDGWHAADGWGPARLPLSEAEYSDDMVEQFVKYSKTNVPMEIGLECDGSQAKMEKRADWIWQNHRRQWIDFYTERWAGFHEKQATALHAIGKQVVINSAWTRDPFEAIYRYGIDYQKIIAAGVDGIVTESAAGASDMEAEDGIRLYNYTAALLLIKAFVSRTKLLFLNGVKDTKEQWDLIRHAPTVYESEILSLSNIYFQKDKNQLERCADGFVVCLGDCISSTEWQWLLKQWDLAFDASPQCLRGATLVWSDNALQNEIDNFIEHRNVTTHQLLHTLMENGAQVHSAVRVENVGNANGTLLVLNADLFPDEELTKVLSYTHGAVMMIGSDGEGNACCRVRREKAETIETLDSTVAISNIEEVVEPITFLDSLPMQEISPEFIASCAAHINSISGAPTVSSGESCIQLQALCLSESRLRLIIRNSRLSYCRPQIDVHQPIESIEIQTAFPCVNIEPQDSQFSIKVPGRGVVVVDVLLLKEN